MTDREEELAVLAAQLIVDDGLDYQSAKRKAYSRLTGRRQPRNPQQELPSNEAVEEAVREHLSLFYGESQPLRLRALREAALRFMDQLPTRPLWLLGAAANGTATQHSGLHLALVGDSSKELAIDLVNHGFTVMADEVRSLDGETEEALRIDWEGEPTVIRLVSHGQDLRRLGAISRTELEALLNDPTTPTPPLEH